MKRALEASGLAEAAITRCKLGIAFADLIGFVGWRLLQFKVTKASRWPKAHSLGPALDAAIPAAIGRVFLD
jgi:hypothetical protein